MSSQLCLYKPSRLTQVYTIQSVCSLYAYTQKIELILIMKAWSLQVPVSPTSPTLELIGFRYPHLSAMKAK